MMLSTMQVTGLCDETEADASFSRCLARYLQRSFPPAMKSR